MVEDSTWGLGTVSARGGKGKVKASMIKKQKRAERFITWHRSAGQAVVYKADMWGFFFFLLSRQTHSAHALLRNTFLSMLSLYS